MAVDRGSTVLNDYVAKNPGFVRIFDSYAPNLDMIERLKGLLPEARLVTVCEYWCGDCRWLVPRMARIAEHLPGWSFEVYNWDGSRRDKPWQVRAVPTFIVYQGEKEVGRIVENTAHGSLEEDLLAIASDT